MNVRLSLSRASRPLVGVVAALSVVSLIALAPAGARTAGAHGGGFTLDKRADAGPYALRLGTIPRTLRPLVDGILIIEVSDARTGERVSAPAASVVVSPKRPDGSATPYGDLKAWADSYDPSLFESRVDLDVEGEWTFTVTVSGDAGTGSAPFALEARSESPVMGIIVLFFLLVLLTILGLSMRAFLMRKDASQKVGRRRA